MIILNKLVVVVVVVEFTAHYTCKSAEINLKSTTTNERIQLLNNKLINGFLGGTLDLV